MSLLRPRQLAVALLCTLLVAVVAHPAPAGAATRRRSPTKTRMYVVVLRDDVDSVRASDYHRYRYGARVKYVYRRAIHGYAAGLTASAVRELGKDPSVERIEADHAVRVRDVPWGLDRLDQVRLPL